MFALSPGLARTWFQANNVVLHDDSIPAGGAFEEEMKQSVSTIYTYTRGMGTRKLSDQEGEAKPLCVKVCCVHKFLCVYNFFLYI